MLSSYFPESIVDLSFNDFESFQMRMELLEPTACHVMELGEVVFGKDRFSELKESWNSKRRDSISVEALTEYLHKRAHFLGRLENTNTLAENISKIEAIMFFRLQVIIISLISDLTVSELVSLDIPSRLPKLIQTLYKNELPQNILPLAPIFEQVHEAKRIAQVFEKGILEDKSLVIKSIRRVLLNSEEVLESLFQIVY